MRDGLRVATVSFMAEAVIAFSNGEQQLSARQMLKFSTQKKNTLIFLECLTGKKAL